MRWCCERWLGVKYNLSGNKCRFVSETLTSVNIFLSRRELLSESMLEFPFRQVATGAGAPFYMSFAKELTAL